MNTRANDYMQSPERTPVEVNTMQHIIFALLSLLLLSPFWLHYWYDQSFESCILNLKRNKEDLRKNLV